jgi:hypothetical protein
MVAHFPVGIFHPLFPGPHTYILVTDASRLISFYDMDGAAWQQTPSPAQQANPILVQPYGVTWAGGIGIIVSDTNQETVVAMVSVSESGAQSTISLRLGALTDVCLSNGSVYVACPNWGLVQIQGSITPGSSFLVAVDLAGASGVCDAGDGNGLFVTGGKAFQNISPQVLYLGNVTWAKGAAIANSPAYQATLTIGKQASLTSSSFVNPCGVSTDSNGNVYVIDSEALNTGALFMAEPLLNGGVPSGGPLQRDPTGKDPLPLDGPLGLCVNKYDNKIYIADTNNGRIVRVDDVTGTNWTTFGTLSSTPSGVAQFAGPAKVFAMEVEVAEVVVRHNPILTSPGYLQLG